MTSEPTVEPAAAPATGPEPRGIGGWLLLPVAGHLLAAIAGTWIVADIARDPATREVAFSLDPPSLTISFIGIALFWALLPLIAIVLLLARSRRFPMAYIISGFALALFSLVEPLIAAADYGFNVFSFVNALVPAFWIAGWSKYMLTSVRVRNTFVN